MVLVERFLAISFYIVIRWCFLRGPQPPHTLTREATVGRLSMLKEKMAPWAAHWATVDGRITLRLAAVEAARARRVDVLDYLCLEWKVAINNVSADEQDTWRRQGGIRPW